VHLGRPFLRLLPGGSLRKSTRPWLEHDSFRLDAHTVCLTRWPHKVASQGGLTRWPHKVASQGGLTRWNHRLVCRMPGWPQRVASRTARGEGGDATSVECLFSIPPLPGRRFPARPWWLAPVGRAAAAAAAGSCSRGAGSCCPSGRAGHAVVQASHPPFSTLDTHFMHTHTCTARETRTSPPCTLHVELWKK